MTRGCILLLYDVFLLKIAVGDFRKQKINNSDCLIIFIMAVLAAGMDFSIPILSRLAGMFFISIPMTLIALIMPGSFGGGDVKLVGCCGAFLGCRAVLQGTVYGILFAGIYCLWLICIKKEKRNAQFALGPYLCAGYILISTYLF